MKHWLIYGIAGVAIVMLGWLPFPISDVGELQPLEVLYVYQQEDGKFCLCSDTGDRGAGGTLEEAFQDLRAGAKGEVFLDTADYVLLSPGMEKQAAGLWQQLRPGCQVCQVSGEPDLEQTAKFLSAHETGLTLLQLLLGQNSLPILQVEEGEMRLVQP